MSSKRGRPTTHGESQLNSPLYAVYSNMKQRCSNPNHKDFKYYGAKGITVCKEWRDSYEAFRDFAHANGWEKGLTIDRIEGEGNYEPGNTRFNTMSEQNRNKAINIKIEIWGESRLLVDAVNDPRCIVSYQTARWRIRSGMTAELALTTPSRKKAA